MTLQKYLLIIPHGNLRCVNNFVGDTESLGYCVKNMQVMNCDLTLRKYGSSNRKKEEPTAKKVLAKTISLIKVKEVMSAPYIENAIMK